MFKHQYGIKAIIALFLLFVGAPTVFAQQEATDSAPRVLIDAGLAAGVGEVDDGGVVTSAAFAIHKTWPVAFKNRLRIGFGGRFTGYYGAEQGFITAPADVTEGNLFAEQNPARLDTLFLLDSQVNSLNAAFFMEYEFSPKFAAGFSIDVMGFSFGAEQPGAFISRSEGNEAQRVDARPTNFNLLLTGDFDRGSLNSEFTVRYKLNDKWYLRGGLSYLFTEFTTDRNLTFDNDRFRNKSISGLIGISYAL